MNIRKMCLAVLTVMIMAACAAPLYAEARQEIMYAEGIFEAIEQEERSLPDMKFKLVEEYMVIKVGGERFSALISPVCRFKTDKGKIIGKDEFVRKYLKRYVDVGISPIDDASLVVECKVR